MHRAILQISATSGAVAAGWGVSEWNQVAGTAAFAAAAIFSIVKTAFLLRDRIALRALRDIKETIETKDKDD